MSYPERRPAGPPAAATPSVGASDRSSEEIRSDIEAQREELGRSVDALRSRVGELTDWRRQLREHRRELIMGAAIAGFAIGGIVALRRRR